MPRALRSSARDEPAHVQAEEEEQEEFRESEHEEEDEDDDDDYEDSRARRRRVVRPAVTSSQGNAESQGDAEGQGTAESGEEALPTTRQGLRAILVTANNSLPIASTKRWKVTGTLAELRAQVLKLKAGRAPEGSKRGPGSGAARRGTTAGPPSQAPGPSKPLAPTLLAQTTDPHLVYEDDAHATFEAPRVLAMVNDLTRRMDQAVPQTYSEAEQGARLFRRVAAEFMRVVEVATNELLPPESQTSVPELERFFGTALVLCLHNGVARRRFEFVEKMYGNTAYDFVPVDRFFEIGKALSMARVSDTSDGSDRHPSRNAEAFAAADSSVRRGMEFLVRGLTRVGVTLDDDVFKNRTKTAARFGIQQVTDRKEQALGHDALSLSLGVVVDVNVARPLSVNETSTTQKEQWLQMLRAWLTNRSETDSWFFADRGFMTMGLMHGDFAVRGCNGLGPLSHRSRSGVYAVRVGTPSKGFTPPPEPAPQPGTFALRLFAPAATTAPSTERQAPRGMQLVDYERLPLDTVRGRDGELRFKVYDVGGDRAVLGGTIVNNQFVGTALVTEHGTARSSSNFATPFGLACSPRDAVSFVNTYVGIGLRDGVDWGNIVFSPPNRDSAKGDAAARLRTALSACPHAVRPGSCKDGTVEWHALHEGSVSGTGMVRVRRFLLREATVLSEILQAADPSALALGVVSSALVRVRSGLGLRVGETDESAVAMARGEEDARERGNDAELGEAPTPDAGLDGAVGAESEPDDGDARSDSGKSDSGKSAEEVAAPGQVPGPVPPPQPPASSSSTVDQAAERDAEVFKGLLGGWLRKHFSTRAMVFGKENEGPLAKWVARLKCRTGPEMGSGTVGIGLSTLVPGVAATPDGVAFEMVRVGNQSVKTMVLDEFKTKVAASTLAAAKDAAEEFEEDQYLEAARVIPLFSEVGHRAVPFVAHRLQLATQMLVWRVPYVRYTVASTKGVVYSVLMHMDDDEMRAFEAIVRRVLAPVLTPLAPLYALDASLDVEDAVANIADAVLHKYGAYLSAHEFALFVSRLPRMVALRRAIPRAGQGEPLLHTMQPLHAIKNAMAWWYNIHKGGVDRMTQHVLRLLDNMDFMDHFGFLRKITMRRLLLLAVSALQLVRVRSASASFRRGTATVVGFRNALANFGNILNQAEQMGLALVARSEPLLGPAPPLAADAALSAEGRAEKRARLELELARLEREDLERTARAGRTPASAAGAASAGSASSAGTEFGAAAVRTGTLAEAIAGSTPVSAALTALEMLAREGLIKAGTTPTHHQLASLSPTEAVAICKTVADVLRPRDRAPAVAQFDADPTLRTIRLASYLDHNRATLHSASPAATSETSSASSSHGTSADVRCVLCKLAGGKARAQGRCSICGVALCSDCWLTFHTKAWVTKAGAESALGSARTLEFP